MVASAVFEAGKVYESRWGEDYLVEQVNPDVVAYIRRVRAGRPIGPVLICEHEEYGPSGGERIIIETEDSSDYIDA